jgi:hypothetical protein
VYSEKNQERRVGTRNNRFNQGFFLGTTSIKSDYILSVSMTEGYQAPADKLFNTGHMVCKKVFQSARWEKAGTFTI